MGRAGRYVVQPTGYRAFLPAPLPPDPPIVLSGELQGLLSAADRALGRLDGSVLTLPNPDLFVFMYVRKEAVLSSQIEGTQSSLQDLLAAEAKLLDPNLPRDVDEVLNYVRAMNHGLARLADLPVSIRLIREIHAQLMEGARGGWLQPGDLRTSQNWIGPAGSTIATASFIPPPPAEVPGALAALENFLHQPDDIPPLVKIALAHVQFETIHPFLDGNGRVARLMSHAMLLEIGIGSALWSVSRGLARNSTDYKRLLMAADEPRRNDLDGRGALSHEALIDFCRFFLEICLDQIRYMRELLDPSELQRRMELYVRDEESAERLPKRSYVVLREALLSGELERGRVPMLIDTSERTARRVISALIDKRLLVATSHKAPLRLGFPIDVVERWFPKLYPVT